MSKFLNPLFWFNQRPDVLIPGSRNVLIGTIFFLLAAAIVSFILKNRGGFLTKFWFKIFNFSLTNAIIGAFLLFFTEELIPFLSSRFWFLLWAAGIITWIVFIVLYVRKLPAKKKEMEQEREYKKYIP